MAQDKTAREQKGNPANPLGNFATTSKAPIDIEADTAQMFDQKKMARFHGNVKVVQGDFEMRTIEMEVFYEDKAADAKSGAKKPAQAAAEKGAATGPGASQIKLIKAKQKVVITDKDGQTATGDWADYDAKEQIAIVGGNVILTKDKSIVKGDRLRIDMKTGESRFEPAVPGTEPVASKATVKADPKALPTAKEITKPAIPAGQPVRPSAVFYPGELQGQQKGQGAQAKDATVTDATKPDAKPAPVPKISEWSATTTEVTSGKVPSLAGAKP